MQRVVRVLVVELPVTGIADTETSTVDCDLASRRPIDQIVDRFRHRAQEIDEARAIVDHAGKDEATLSVNAWRSLIERVSRESAQFWS